MNLSYCFELTSRVLLPPSVSSPYVNTLHNLRSLLKRNSTWTFNQYRASKVNFWKVNCSPRPRLIHYWFDFGHQLFGRRLNVQVFFFFCLFQHAAVCSALQPENGNQSRGSPQNPVGRLLPQRESKKDYERSSGNSWCRLHCSTTTAGFLCFPWSM